MEAAYGAAAIVLALLAVVGWLMRMSRWRQACIDRGDVLSQRGPLLWSALAGLLLGVAAVIVFAHDVRTFVGLAPFALALGVLAAAGLSAISLLWRSTVVSNIFGDRW